MKLLQKSLLFASLLAVGTSIASIPELTTGNGTAQAATVTDATPDGFYFLVSKDRLIKARLIKASDVKILTKDTQTDADMITTDAQNDFRLEVNVPEAQLYNLKGDKVSHHLSKGTVCTIGSQVAFDNSTYYKVSKHSFLQSHDSTWI